MDKKKIDKQKVAFIAVTVALIISVSYIAFEQYQAVRTQEQISVYQQGLQAGYEQAVMQLLQQITTCEQVPITFGNNTINVIAVECLQQTQ